MTATLHAEIRDQRHQRHPEHQDRHLTQDLPSAPDLRRGPDWGDETGAQTAEYGIVTLAAVGFAGVLAVILAGADVQGLLLDIVKNALSFG